MNGALRFLGVVAAMAFLVWAGAQADARASREPAPAVAAVSTAGTTEARKGGDGAACSSGDECRSGTCEGGSCCTAHGDTCDSSSHCCGHQSCTDGTCP